jgi:hypothetical protein
MMSNILPQALKDFTDRFRKYILKEHGKKLAH